MARQREVPRQLRKLVRGVREQCTRVVQVEHGGAREVHEITQWCTRLQSGARWYTSRSSDGQAVWILNLFECSLSFIFNRNINIILIIYEVLKE